MSRARILIADDHRLIADAYERLLDDAYTIVGKVEDGRALLARAEELQPDVIVMDISMPRLSGLEAVPGLREVAPAARLVFVTMHKDPRTAARALDLGAAAYVLKASAASELLEAVDVALRGGRYVTPLLRPSEIESARKVPKREGRRLTPRQREVLQLLAEGRIMKQIALELGLSTRTVAHHKYKLMREQGIESNAELIQLAIEEGLIAPPTAH